MSLSDIDKLRYQWQIWVGGFGEAGQEKLKNASVLVSRCGGVGGTAAFELAAAGVGRIVLAHAGPLREDDLNRQLLMSHAGIGESRVEQAAKRLSEFNPRIEVVAVPENISDDNALRLIRDVDLVLDAAPLFVERYAMNRAAVQLAKPIVECAMYDLEAHCTTIQPGQTPCLRCMYPEDPAHWRRQFPVFGAVAGMIGCIGAMEAIKLLAGLGDPLLGRLLTVDLRTMSFRVVKIWRDPACEVCGGHGMMAPAKSDLKCP